METDTEKATEEQAPAQPKNYRGRGDHGGAAAAAAQLTLGPRDVLEGKLSIEGDIRVLGTVTGELRASGDVNVEQQANVNAPIEARNVTVRGNLSGDVTAREKLILAGSGSVSGNVKVARLTIEDGATLNGNVQMQASQGGSSRHHSNGEGAEG